MDCLIYEHSTTDKKTMFRLVLQLSELPYLQAKNLCTQHQNTIVPTFSQETKTAEQERLCLSASKDTQTHTPWCCKILATLLQETCMHTHTHTHTKTTSSSEQQSPAIAAFTTAHKTQNAALSKNSRNVLCTLFFFHQTRPFRDCEGLRNNCPPDVHSLAVSFARP